MKVIKLFRFASVFLVITGSIAFCAESAIACTCVHQKLSKRFRKAEAVFVGTPVYVDENDPGQVKSIQNFKKGLSMLKVKKSWKGVKSETIAVELDFNTYGGNCPNLTRFEVDEDYLIFAYGKDLKVTVGCPDSAKITKGSEYPHNEMKRLDRFWFRLWARIKPF